MSAVPIWVWLWLLGSILFLILRWIKKASTIIDKDPAGGGPTLFVDADFFQRFPYEQ